MDFRWDDIDRSGCCGTLISCSSGEYYANKIVELDETSSRECQRISFNLCFGGYLLHDILQLQTDRRTHRNMGALSIVFDFASDCLALLFLFGKLLDEHMQVSEIHHSRTSATSIVSPSALSLNLRIPLWTSSDLKNVTLWVLLISTGATSLKGFSPCRISQQQDSSERYHEAERERARTYSPESGSQELGLVYNRWCRIFRSALNSNCRVVISPDLPRYFDSTVQVYDTTSPPTISFTAVRSRGRTLTIRRLGDGTIYGG